MNVYEPHYAWVGQIFFISWGDYLQMRRETKVLILRDLSRCVDPKGFIHFITALSNLSTVKGIEI